MKIKIVFDVNADTREAVAHHYGFHGRATHQMCKDNINTLVKAHFEDLVYDLDAYWKNVRAGGENE